MTQLAQQTPSGLAVVKVLLGVAIAAAAIAAAAGLVLLVATPESGSSTEAALGLTAAAAGIATAMFAVTAAIYAQIKNLWQYAPTWVRAGAWALIAIVVISSLWGTIA